MRNDIRTVNDVSKVINNQLENIAPSINELSNNLSNNLTNNNKEVIIVCPIDNNVLNEDENENEIIDDNNHALVPESNVTIIEENKEPDESFNYIKEFSDNFNAYDPEEKYPSC
jgi:hypothetical protein